MRQIKLLIKACSVPHLIEGYSGDGIPNKTRYIERLVRKIPGKVAVGCTSIAAFDLYESRLRECFPDRPVFVVKGDVAFKKRQSIVTEFDSTINGILVCTQQSLSSSVNIPTCNDVILESLQWNIPKMEQFYFRFIRLDSKELKDVHYVTYKDSVEQNLMALVLTKERLNEFIKTGEVKEQSEIFEEFDVTMSVIETMNEIRKAATSVDPTIFIYGEGWAASAPQMAEDSLAMKANTYKMPGVAAFSDEMRDALRGPFNDNHQGAFLAGLPGGEESIKFGIVGAIRHPQVNNDSVNYSKAPWAEQPTQMISYVSCHDDMCLVDRLKASIPGITPVELAKLDKLAQTAVFTSQGVPFIYAGEEVMRDKKGVHNSFESPDSINAIDWRRKAEHADVFAYYKGLIQLRTKHPAFRMGDADLVRKHLEFLPVDGSNVVVYRLKENANGDAWGDIILVLNARKEPAKLTVPEGKYTVVCKDGFINEQGLGTLYGPEVVVPAQSALIMYK